MAYDPTMPTDVSPSNAVSNYVSATLFDNLAFNYGGIVSPDYSDLALNGGSLVEIKRFAFDANDAELDDGTASEGKSIAVLKDLAVVTRRKRVRPASPQASAAMGAPTVSEADNAVINELAMQSADFWGKQIDKTLGSVLKGLFTTNGVLTTTHLNDFSAANTKAILADAGEIIDTLTLGGDQMRSYVAIVCHPKVYGDLIKDAKNWASTPSPVGTLGLVGSYLGMNVIVSDLVPTSGSGEFKKYDSFIFKPGSLGVLFQKNVSSKLGFDPYRNMDVLTQSAAFAPHVFGVKWVGTPSSADAGPDNTELATAANWQKVATQDKEIGVLCFRSNASQ